MKLCIRCQQVKASAEFNVAKRNRDGLHSYCRDCQSAHYRENRSRHMKNVRRTSAVRLKLMHDLMSEAMAGGCVDCGITDIRVLEFDHVSGVKVANVSRIIRDGRSVDALRAEIAKCEVRCRNCHAIATYERMEHPTWRVSA